MTKVKVLLDSLEKVNTFVNRVDKYEGDVRLKSGNIVVDAKSIIGVLNCDLTRPITVMANSGCENILKPIAEFITK